MKIQQLKKYIKEQIQYTSRVKDQSFSEVPSGFGSTFTSSAPCNDQNFPIGGCHAYCKCGFDCSDSTNWFAPYNPFSSGNIVGLYNNTFFC